MIKSDHEYLTIINWENNYWKNFFKKLLSNSTISDFWLSSQDIDISITSAQIKMYDLIIEFRIMKCSENVLQSSLNLWS